MAWSYNISCDDRNTHTIDDPSYEPGSAWVGVPIIVHKNEQALGVLRVKNKVPSARAPEKHFCSIDIHNLETIAAELATLINQSVTYQQKKLFAEERAKELSQLEEFLRTFRHEIRSPVQAICFAPERLLLIMRNENMINSRADLPKKLGEYLADFKATGNRLELISKALTLHPDELVKDIQLQNIFKDCIAPVLAFATPYAARKNRRISTIKDSLLINMEFDAVALSIAFHVLIDNAIKYSDEPSAIQVYGMRIPGGVQIVVENRTDTFSIDASDIPHIFEKYYRGIAARSQKLEGSGIGLYLADQIMELHHGELVLLQANSPVKFALRLKN